jgi:predicted phosphodiesterase
MSDFHSGASGKKENILRSITVINEEKPDLIVLLGDYTDAQSRHNSMNIEKRAYVFDILPRLEAPLGIYAVLGNHDHLIDAAFVEEQLSRPSAVILNNQSVALDNGLALAGVDDFMEGFPDPLKAVKKLSHKSTTILLSHNPDVNLQLRNDERVSLIISGLGDKAIQMKNQQFLRHVIMFFTILLLSLPMQSYAFDVTLQWDANTELDLDHYVVYWRTSSGSYTWSSDSIPSDTTTYEVQGLPNNETYCFAVKAWDNEGNESAMDREVCVLGSNDLDPNYDRGWKITAGDLKGFAVIYDSGDPTPTLGSSSEIPALSKPKVNGAGLPLNLETQPSGITFNTPVKIFIPCPGYSDVSDLDIFYYDDVRKDWYLANDADTPDMVQPDAIDWMVERSRYNHNYSEDPSNDPSTIEIQVKHFSGTQAAARTTSSSSSGGGGCFIATTDFGTYR